MPERPPPKIGRADIKFARRSESIADFGNFFPLRDGARR
jgi:hypothetical protein